MISRTRQLRKPLSSQTQGMTMRTLTHGITPTNIKSQTGVKSKGYQPLVTPTARKPLNQVPLPPQRANKCLCPQEQGSPKSTGLALQKPLSLQGNTQGQRVRTMREEMAWREVSDEFPLADRSKLDVQYKVAPRAGWGGGGAIIEVKMSGKDKWYQMVSPLHKNA